MSQNLNKSTESVNNCNTMEAENHLKTGAILKSQMSNSMFTMRRFIFIGIVLLSFFIVGCTKDNKDEKPATVEEDKANIKASFDRTKNLLENFKNGSFYKFADKFIDYHEEERTEYHYNWVDSGKGDYSYNNETSEYDYTPGVGEYERGSSYSYYDDVISEFTETLGEKLGDVIDGDDIISNDERFNFAALAGKYTWNISSGSWSKTSNSTVLLMFPSSKDKTGNDCEAAITDYKDKQCDIEGNVIYLPTKANVYLKQDGDKLFSADLSADFSGYGIPTQVTVNVYAKPLKFDVSLNQDSPTKFKADVNIADETRSENNLIIGCEATLSNGLTQYSDFDDMDLNVLKLNIKQHELSIVGTVDLKTLDGLSSTAENINNCINFEVLYKTQKAGTLKVVDLDNNQYLYIVYKDGTQENTSIYYDSFIEDIETMFTKYLK